MRKKIDFIKLASLDSIKNTESTNANLDASQRLSMTSNLQNLDSKKLTKLNRFHNAVKNYKKASFISLYALILSLSISLVALHTLRTLALKKDITLALLFQKQSLLYALSLKSLVLACLRRFDFMQCQKDSIKFDSHFSGSYVLNRSANNILLDIMIHARTLLSTHPLHFSRRYIIKGYVWK